MKLIETVYDLLLEAAPEQIYQKYYSDIDRSTFLRIIQLDPRTKVKHEKENGIKKIGRYAKVLLKMHKEGNLKSEDHPKAKDYLTLVYKHNVSVDISKVKTLGDLFTLVEKYYSQSTNKNVFDLINVLDDNDYDLLLSGDKWIIYKPKSEKGAAYLGTGTEWCTAWGPYSTNEKYRDRKNHFSSHSDRGPLYVILNRDDSDKKYQFHFETKQYMDRNDRKIDTGDFLESNPEVCKFFFPSLYDDTEVSDLEMERIGVLNRPQTAKLIERSVGETDNRIVETLVNDEGDELISKMKSFITDPNLESLDYDYRLDRLEFSLSDIGNYNWGNIETCRETLSRYRYDSDPYAEHSERLRYDITEMDEDYQKEQIEPLLKKYYDEVVLLPKVNSYERYRELINDYWDDIVNDFADEYAYLNEGTVRDASETELNAIERFISIDDNLIQVPTSHLALFIHKEKLKELSDIESLFEAYIESHNLAYEYEDPMYNINLEYPSLKDMTPHFEGYTKKIEDDLNQAPECLENKDRLAKLRKELFNGGNNFSRDDLRIEIRGGYNCEKEGVPVIVNYLKEKNSNVSNWERWSGHLSIDRISEYITNERLFENN